MSLCIQGLATAVPKHSIDQDSAAAAAVRLCGLTEKQSRLLPALYRHAGVRRRHSVVLAGTAAANGDPSGQSFYQSVEAGGALGPSTAERMRVYAECATPLAAEACRRALGAAEMDANEITHLVTVSCSGFSAPGVDVRLVRELGLTDRVARVHVGFMGCHGALNGLRVARAFIDADPNANVLVSAVELCSLHHQYGWNPDQIVANALFADGAAAAVCVGEGRQPDGSSCLHGLTSGSTIVPETDDLMSWRIGDHGFEMGLSPKVPDTIRSTLRNWLAGWLAGQGLDIDRIGRWAIHPGGPRILQACAEALELDSEAIATSKSVLADYGNMSSPTILFIVERLVRQSAPGPWVLLAFGPGLTIEAALVEPHFAPAAKPVRAAIAAV